MTRELTAAEETYFACDAFSADADDQAEQAQHDGLLIERYYQMSVAAAMRDVCRKLEDESVTPTIRIQDAEEITWRFNQGKPESVAIRFKQGEI